MEIDDKEGNLLVKIAREAIEKYIKERAKIAPSNNLPQKFREKSGVFVTINKISGKEKELRGCIGYPYPLSTLIDALIDSSIAAVSEDFRFEPLSVDELDTVVLEVSVLTNPEQIIVKSPREYPSKINVGEDGLVIKYGGSSGLLLPQVPIEYKWDAEEFLSNACLKAGVTPDAWLMPGCFVYKFKAIIFEEIEPRGEVIRKKL